MCWSSRKLAGPQCAWAGMRRDLAFLLKPNWGPEEAGEPQASSAMEAGTPGGQATPDLRALAETAAMARAEAAQTPLQGPPQN